jgi:hypothetical protein
MEEGCPWMVVLLAYMICLRCVWGSVSTAPPDFFIVLPPARHGNSWRVFAALQARLAEIHCARE